MLRSQVPNDLNGANGSGDLLSVDALAVFVSRPQVVCINTAAMPFCTFLINAVNSCP